MKKPDYYYYPAVFTFEPDSEIAVTFPDLPGCTTSGHDEPDALNMAIEALGGHLCCLEDFEEDIPTPSSIRDVVCEPNEKVILVSVYMPSIRLAQINKSVNRTVTLPAWLNATAVEHNINFSQLLQEAIKQQLKIKV